MTAATPWKFGVARPVRERFEEKFRVTPGCWPWLAPTNPKGYGRMRIAGKDEMAHRVSYELYVGQIPAGGIICHSCDNPACVNPDHLWPGTDKSNAEDKMQKGRWSCGVRKPGQELSYAKLSDDEIYAIRADGRSYSEIARSYGIAISHARYIKLREAWNHLPTRGDERQSEDGRSLRRPTLTRDQQEMVRADPRSQTKIAADFGVSQSVISQIKLRLGCYAADRQET